MEAYPVQQINPGANVTHTATSNTITRSNADNLFGVQNNDYHDGRIMDHALVNRHYELLRPFANNLRDEARSIGTPIFLQIKALAALEWGQSTPAERNGKSRDD